MRILFSVDRMLHCSSKKITVPGSYQEAMGHGWTLVVPDYEGLNSSLGAGHLNGKAVLDSMRAALASSVGLSPTSRIGAFGMLVISISGLRADIISNAGYSGGAYATGGFILYEHYPGNQRNL